MGNTTGYQQEGETEEEGTTHQISSFLLMTSWVPAKAQPLSCSHENQQHHASVEEQAPETSAPPAVVSRRPQRLPVRPRPRLPFSRCVFCTPALPRTRIAYTTRDEGADGGARRLRR